MGSPFRELCSAFPLPDATLPSPSLLSDLVYPLPRPIPTDDLAHLTQLVGVGGGIEDSAALVVLDALVLDHAAIEAGVVALDGEGGLGDGGVDDEVVVAVGAVLVGLLELLGVLAEALAALLARERHLERPQQIVRLLLLVALRAVEPLPACLRSLPEPPRAAVISHLSIYIDLCALRCDAVRGKRADGGDGSRLTAR